jgi:hypothetical protein
MFSKGSRNIDILNGNILKGQPQNVYKLYNYNYNYIIIASGTGQNKKPRNDEKRRFTDPKCKNGKRNRGLRQQLSSEMGIKDPGARQQLHPRIEKMLYEIFRERIVKQVVRTPNGLQKIRKWTLWRGRPPPKWKKT